jgi:protein-S-isoprenylcysteine O-methyltransferase Ste14
MKASRLEFRLRMVILAAILTVGMWAPWVGAGQRIPLLEWLALEISRLWLLTFAAATPAVIVLATLIAAKGALLRVWGTAWLGPATVLNSEMTAGPVMADGPYRYVRNPLYLGLWSMTVALAFLMPPTGALLVLIAVPVFLLRLILGEEVFLAGQLGEPYLAYKRAVPRIFPRLRTNLAPSGRKPRWLRGVLSELTSIGIFLTFATLSWSYNNEWMIRAILVSFGISLMVRGFLPREDEQFPTPAK